MVVVADFTISMQLERAVLHIVAAAFALSVDATALCHAMSLDAHQDSHARRSVCLLLQSWMASG